MLSNNIMLVWIELLFGLLFLLRDVESNTISSTTAPNDETIKLNRVAMIMTHNSATGEDSTNKIGDGQVVNMVQQLNCGTRAFDYRPRVDDNDGIVKAWHGIIDINEPMTTSIGNVITWLNNHPTELVILYLSKFKGTNAPDAAQQVLLNLGITTNQIIRDNCSLLSGLTYGSTKSFTSLSGGGHLLVVFGCVDEKYDASIKYSSSTYDNDLDRFYNYMESNSYLPNADSITNGYLWMVQAHWQYNNKQPYQDEIDTDLNRKVANKINNKSYGFLNFIEVDNVCNGSNELIQAVYDFNNKPTIQTTVSNCLSYDQTLLPNEYIESDNEQFRARLDVNGKLCIHDSIDMFTTPQWCEDGNGLLSTTSQVLGSLKMQRDSNLVLYTPAKEAYWNSGTTDAGNNIYLKIQNDRHLVLYDENNIAKWACAFADPTNPCFYYTDQSSCDIYNCGQDTICTTKTVGSTSTPTQSIMPSTTPSELPSTAPSEFPSTTPSSTPSSKPSPGGTCVDPAGQCTSTTLCCSGIGKCSGGKPENRKCLSNGDGGGDDGGGGGGGGGGGDCGLSGADCSSGADCCSSNCKKGSCKGN